VNSASAALAILVVAIMLVVVGGAIWFVPTTTPDWSFSSG
jgi:hypothetical protein